MGNIETLTVEDILATKEMKIASGEIVSGKQYLDDAITAFGLNRCDYYTAFKTLIWIAKGHNANTVTSDIKSFWQAIEHKYE